MTVAPSVQSDNRLARESVEAVISFCGMTE